MDTTSAWDTLYDLRDGLYHQALGRRKDTLFELADALLVAPGPLPLVHHSLSPAVHRRWPSLPDALTEGTLEPSAIRRLVLPRLPTERAPPVWVVDGTTWPRPAAVTSPERTWSHRPRPGIPQHGLIPGWEYQWLITVPDPGTSWVLPLDVARRGPDSATPTPLALTQLRRVLAAAPAAAPRPVVTFDSGYDLGELLEAIHAADPRQRLPIHALVRLSRRRRLWLAPPPYRGRGRRPTYGPVIKLGDPATHPAPDQTLTLPDDRHDTLTIELWRDIRVRPFADHPFCLVRIQPARLPRSARPPEPVWLAWLDPSPPADLGDLWRWYALRFTVEHGFRFAKQDLGWTTIRLRHPAAADRWTWLIALVWWQLWLARQIVADQRLPWERVLPAARLTPRRVRRALGPILTRLGSPVRAVQPRGKSSGRLAGQCPGPSPRYPVAYRRPRPPPPAA